MAESKIVSVRIPQNLLDRIDKLAADRYPARRADGEPNRSQLILDALEAISDDAVNKIDEFEGRIEAVVVDSVNKIDGFEGRIEAVVVDSVNKSITKAAERFEAGIERILDPSDWLRECDRNNWRARMQQLRQELRAERKIHQTVAASARPGPLRSARPTPPEI